MSKVAEAALEPRKTPVQARSTATVEAIFEATIQVLLKAGLEGLTTTRVAERAGVSVGTLYQYFPHKQALLRAVLEMHLLTVVEAVEAAARAGAGKPLEGMVDEVIAAFVGAKLARTEVSRALYAISADLQVAPILESSRNRSRCALEAMLRTAADARFHDPAAVASMLYAVLVGTTRAVMEADSLLAMGATLRSTLVVVCGAYLESVKG